MTVITFPPKVPREGSPWPAAELKEIVETLAPQLTSGEAGGWDVGVTEIGDPQFYLLGPAPHDECILCISRLGRAYVLEDGAGQVLFEHNSLVVLAEHAKTFLQKKKTQTVARIALLWCAIREALEEKLEPIVGESEELLTHFVPQLAAFA
jgi:hypothetical protein